MSWAFDRKVAGKNAGEPKRTDAADNDVPVLDKDDFAGLLADHGVAVAVAVAVAGCVAVAERVSVA